MLLFYNSECERQNQVLLDAVREECERVKEKAAQEAVDYMIQSVQAREAVKREDAIGQALAKARVRGHRSSSGQSKGKGGDRSSTG